LGDQYAGLSNIAQGLANLAVGVRTTYMLLEEVKTLLRRQARGGHYPWQFFVSYG
jgi:hypothetical protein